MFRVTLPFTDAVLLLAPQGGETAGPWHFILLALLALVPVALVLWLYHYELRLVSRPVALSLLALRLLVVGLLIFVVGLQPILTRTSVEHLPGRVLVAFDASESMDVADPQRSSVDKLRLARALRLAEDICPAEQLDAWVRQYEETGAPQWTAPGEFPDEARPLRLRAEEERQRQHDQVCRRIDTLTRAHLAQRVLAEDGARLLPAVAARHQVELIGFAEEAWDVPPDQVADVAPEAQPNGEPRSRNTDLRLPLVQAQERTGPDRGRILGVIVLTDGQHNRGPSPVARALELGEHRLPVYPVALGSRQPPPDITLACIKAPAAVFKDVDATVEARIKVSGLPGQDLAVELERPGQPTQAERIRHDGKDRYYTVSFSVRLEQPGTQTLNVTARPVAGEIRSDNNGRPVVINVADDKAKVLLADGEARWEYHYLANALLRDRSIQLQPVVFIQPRVGKVPEDELKKIGNPARALPTEPDALAGYDCIILGDVSPAQLPLADRQRLEKYVADRGGTLVIVAGKRSMPLAFASTEPRAAEGNDPLIKLLPIQDPRVFRPVKGFPVTLTHEGKLTPFLQMEATADKSDARWAELPRHFWGMVGRAKSGATALAFVADEAAGLKPAGEHEKEQALIARQHYGFGRVVFVGLDSTWRWRYKEGDTYHHRFWGQLIRWAASDKPLVAGNDFVRFGTREPVYRQGQDVDLVVRLGEETPPLRPDALAGARVIRVGEKERAVAVVPLGRKEAQPRVLEGRVRDLPAGLYAVEVVIPELADKLHGPPGPDGQPGKLRASFTVTRPESEEMVELATNWPLLEELASKSGGKVFTPETAGELADLLVRQSVPHELRSEHKLWQWWPTLVVFLVLLTVEWVGRKLAGLP